MTIEKVQLKDAEEILQIYAPYVKETAVSFEYTIPSVEEFRDRIQRISSKYPYIKAVVNGKIMGYAYADSFKGRKAYDWSVETTIYIRNDAKRQGIGRRLYEQLETSLIEMGILNMNACIAMPETEDPYVSEDSFHFHSRMGFALVGRFHQSGYKFHRWYDMIWMEKRIGQHSEQIEEVRFGNWKV